MFVVVPVSDEHTPPKSHLASLSTTRTKLRCKPPSFLSDAPEDDKPHRDTIKGEKRKEKKIKLQNE